MSYYSRVPIGDVDESMIVVAYTFPRKLIIEGSMITGISDFAYVRGDTPIKFASVSRFLDNPDPEELGALFGACRPDTLTFTGTRRITDHWLGVWHGRGHGDVHITLTREFDFDADGGLRDLYCAWKYSVAV